MSTVGIILLLILWGFILIFLMPLRYTVRWSNDADHAHKIAFEVIIFRGLFGLSGSNDSGKFTFQYSLFFLKKDYIPKEGREKAEKPSKKKPESKSKPTRIKKYGRKILTNFTPGELKRILRKTGKSLWTFLRPDYLRADLICGTGNPMWTGLVFGLIWSSDLYTKTESTIQPDYIRAILAGTAMIEGSFSLGSLLWQVIQIIVYVIYIIVSKKGSKLVAQFSS